MTRKDIIFYRVCRDALAIMCFLLWRLKVEGVERLPEGPFILSPVHRSNIDTPLAGAITTRRMCFFGKESMWKYRWSAWLFNNLGGVPVRRGASDREALRKCMDVLQRGEPLVIFPEGGRRSGPVVEPLQEGAAYLSVKAGVPIVPVGIGGSERAMAKGAKLPRLTKIWIVVGEPIFPEISDRERGTRRAVRELNERLRHEIQRLFDEAQLKAGA